MEPWANIPEVWVSDTGPGIATADVERIFEPFVRLDDSLSSPDSGVGLGLALVKRLVELHGGSVRVEANHPIGAKFITTFAADSTTPPRAAVDEVQVTPTDAQHGTERIPVLLLAEDSEASILMIRDFLTAKGYNVRVARDGLSAVTAASEPDVALILMDIQLPRLDGLTAMRQIRAAEQGAPRPIIALTACAMPEDNARCHAAGATAYVSKPFVLDALAYTVATLLKAVQK